MVRIWDQSLLKPHEDNKRQPLIGRFHDLLWFGLQYRQPILSACPPKRRRQLPRCLDILTSDGWHREGGHTWVKSHVINKNCEFTNKLLDLSYQKLCLVTKRMNQLGYVHVFSNMSISIIFDNLLMVVSILIQYYCITWMIWGYHFMKARIWLMIGQNWWVISATRWVWVCTNHYETRICQRFYEYV